MSQSPSVNQTGMLTLLPPPPEGKIGWPWTVEYPLEKYDPKVVYPPITLVTPSYNHGEFLEETIRSVLLQNYPNLEYMVIDGGSQDGTRGILEKYKPWLSFAVSEPDRGQSHAINKGLGRMTGEIFNWLNSDDYLVPNALELVGSSFFCHPDVESIVGQVMTFGQDGPKRNSKNVPAQVHHAGKLSNFHVKQMGTFFRRAALEKMGPLNEELNYIMDYEWYLKFYLYIGSEKQLELPYILANFRHHESSKSIADADRFTSEVFGLFKYLTEKMKLAEFRDFFTDIRTSQLTFNFELKRIDADQLYPLIRAQILRRSSWVYTASQFRWAKYLIRSLEIDESSLSAEEKGFYDRIRATIRWRKWTIYNLYMKLKLSPLSLVWDTLEKSRQLDVSFTKVFLRLLYYRYKGLRIIAHPLAKIYHLENLVLNGTLNLGMLFVGFVHPRDLTLIRLRGQLEILGDYRIGQGSRIDIGPQAKVQIGKGGYLNPHCKIIISKGLRIGDDCAISWDVQILDDDFHQIQYPDQNLQALGPQAISIGHKVWIGSRATILKGVSIADGCIIAAGSLVTKSFDQPNCLIAGVPARIIKRGISW